MAKLIILRGDQHSVFELNDDATSVGRAPDNMLWLDDPGLSRYHCEFRRSGAQWLLRDLGSFNGSFVNNLLVTEHTLRSGDRIQLGSTVLYFAPDEGAAGAAPAAKMAPTEGEDAQLATSHKLHNFTALIEITKALNSEIDKTTILETIVNKGIELIKAERGFLILVQDGVLDFKVARNRDKTQILNPSKLISRSVLDGVTKTGAPVLTTNAQTALSGSMSITALEVRSLICVPLRLKERNLGALYVDSKVAEAKFNEESRNLLHAFADQAAIAIENARLFDEVAGLSALREKLLADLMTATEAVQRRISESIHDGALQDVLAARQELAELATIAPGDEHVEHARACLQDASRRLREVTFELHPAVLDQAGLGAAVEQLTSSFTANRSGIAITTDIDYPIQSTIDPILFGVVRELLSNVVRHSRATHASVTLGVTDKRCLLDVADNGIGMTSTTAARRLGEGHIGLASHRTRVEAAGGKFTLLEEPVGTHVRVELPLRP